MDKWISVNDRLPTENDNYKVLRDGKEEIIGYVAHSKSMVEPYWLSDKITHWMPLPPKTN